jgi:uncharacterized protein (DUF305 family)
MKRITTLLLSAGALALAACSGGETGDNVAANEAGENASANSMTNDPNNPFGAAEMQMHERMTAATGANASETWVRKMIEHHRGGIAMSDILLAQGGDQRFLDKARASAEMQRRDIAELERMLSGGVTGGNGPANPFGPVETRMHDQMMAATGTNPAETWARKMIAHHQGAIDMSQILIDQGGDPEVVAAARRTIEMQRREISELERMLGGGASAPAATATPAEAGTAAPAARPPSAAPKAAPAPRREQPKETAPRPVPSPEPAPAPKTDCTPEHRAAGHC